MQEDLCPDFQNPHKTPGMQCICNSRNREEEIGGTLDLTGLVKSVVCEFSERYCVKELSWEVIKEGSNVFLWPLTSCTCMNT